MPQPFGAQHALQIRRLYKFILRLHRGLPPDLQTLGDLYVREEFKKHASLSDAEVVKNFASEWAQYAKDLSKQLGTGGIKRKARIGSELEDLGKFSDEQLRQLLELKLEAEKKNVE